MRAEIHRRARGGRHPRSAAESLETFWRWWWANRRGEFRAWLRSPHRYVPKPARAAFRASGGELSNQ